MMPRACWRNWRPWCNKRRSAAPVTQPDSSHAGALGLGWLSTWFLNGTLEDLLALGLAVAVAYVSVVNLPLKRREAKDRLRELCSQFVGVSGAARFAILHLAVCVVR